MTQRKVWKHAQENKLNAELCLGSNAAGSQKNAYSKAWANCPGTTLTTTVKMGEFLKTCHWCRGMEFLPLPIGLIFENIHAGNVLTFPLKSHFRNFRLKKKKTK